MKNPLRLLVCPLLLTAAFAPRASAELLANGNFTGIIDTSGKGYTYGQFGSDSANPVVATGSVLTIPSWDTSGYNFVYTPGSADQGTKAAGAKTGTAGVTQEAPGQATITVNNVKYGNTFLYGKNNGGTVTAANPNPFATNPFSGNFVAADAAYETGAITQTVSGLRTGQAYTLTFYWAVAQQESFAGTNTGNAWQVSLGSLTFSTTPTDLASGSFSGWMQSTTTFKYTDAATSATLSFLAKQASGGNPPFLLLGGVSLVPEPSSGTLLALVGAGLTAGWCVRRRRLAAADARG